HHVALVDAALPEQPALPADGRPDRRLEEGPEPSDRGADPRRILRLGREEELPGGLLQHGWTVPCIFSVRSQPAVRRPHRETFHKSPELVPLDKRPEILSVKQVVATEKLHGSNFRVLFPAGMQSPDEARFGGRNEVFAPGDDGFYGGK